MDVQWNRVPGAQSYVVNYGTSPDQLDQTHTTTEPSATIGNLQPDTTHYFQVQAQPSKPGSPSSEIVSSTTEVFR